MVLHNAIGAIFIGSVLSTVLYGVSCAQVYYYFGHNKKDNWYFKSLVLAVWISDTVHQALISHSTYAYVITNYADIATLNDLINSLLVQFLFTALTAVLVQSYFTFKVWQLSDRNYVMAGIVFGMDLAGFVSTIVYTAFGLQSRTFAQLDAFKHLILCANIFSAVPNVSITAATFYLASTRKKDAYSDIINHSLEFCLETGLMFSIFSVTMMITGIVMPDSTVYLCFLFILSRAYLNSLLFVLNRRKDARGTSGSHSEKHSLSRPRTRLPVHGRSAQGNIAIRIDTVQEFAGDTGSPVDDPFKSTLEMHDSHESA